MMKNIISARSFLEEVLSNFYVQDSFNHKHAHQLKDYGGSDYEVPSSVVDKRRHVFRID